MSHFLPLTYLFDTTVGTSAFCVGRERVYVTGSASGNSKGSTMYSVCNGVTNGDLAQSEKDKFKMMTWDQYNALLRSWEKTDGNWSGGTTGSGYPFVERQNSSGVTKIFVGAASPCTIDDNFFTLETTNGDFVRVPSVIINGCRSFYIAPTIFDFDGSDDGFTLFTETENRKCSKPLKSQGIHYVRLTENPDNAATDNQVFLYIQKNSGSLSEYVSTDDSTNIHEWLATDHTVNNGCRTRNSGVYMPCIEHISHIPNL